MRLKVNSERDVVPAADLGRDPAPPRPLSFDPERLGLALIGGAFALMLALSWQKWADPIIDFGREIYVAWRLSEGDILYRDVAYLYSPFSPWVNSFWFAVFGVSYRSLVFGNTLLLAAILALLYRLLRKLVSLSAATASLLMVVLVFSFSQYIPVGNYNFISPYSHEVTHGLLLSLLALSALSRYWETGSRLALAMCGLTLGLVFLTKYEMLLAALGAVLFPSAWFWRSGSLPLWRTDVFYLLAPIPVPFLACWALLSHQRPVWAAFRDVLGAYPSLLNADLVTNQFFVSSATGTGAAGALAAVVAWSVFYAVSTLPASLLGRGSLRLDDRIYAAASFLLPCVAVALGSGSLTWTQALVPLPFFLTAMTIRLLWYQHKWGRPSSPKDGLWLALTVFSLLLLAKIPLAARVAHYGFALAMPGAALVVSVALDRVAPWLDSLGYRGRYFRFAAFGLLASFLGVQISLNARFLDARKHTLGAGADAILVDARGAVTEQAVQAVLKHVGTHQTLVVLPEGAMINYLARRKSSVSHVIFNPSTLSIYGEPTLLAEMKEHPPDYVLALSREMRSLREYGCAVFGEDCAQAIVAWQRDNYSPLVAGVFQGRRLFTLLVRKKEGLPPPKVELVEVRWR